MSKHTPEPWIIDPIYGFLIDKNGDPSYPREMAQKGITLAIAMCEVKS